MSFFKYPAYTYNQNAAEEIVPVIMKLLNPKSVIDIGCGTGTWLRVFEKYGATDLTGVDHPETDLTQFSISKEKFIPANLSQPFRLNKKYDLVVCLEVAEHLPASAADTFMESLASLGDIILFSAAIPYQGGEGHVNEQWPQYWVDKFKKHDYFFNDSIRFRLWSNNKVEWWYRQNIFLIVNRKSNRFSLPESNVLPLVHPELYEDKSKSLQNALEGRRGVKETLRILLRALKLRYF